MSDLDIRPVQDEKGTLITVDIYDDGEQTVEIAPGKKLILLNDSFISQDPRMNPTDRKHPGVRARWAIVLRTTPYAQKLGIEEGDKVLLDQMKWRRGIYVNDFTGRRVWFISADDVSLMDPDGPDEDEQFKIQSRFEVDLDDEIEEVL